MTVCWRCKGRVEGMYMRKLWRKYRVWMWGDHWRSGYDMEKDITSCAACLLPLIAFACAMGALAVHVWNVWYHW